MLGELEKRNVRALNSLSDGCDSRVTPAALLLLLVSEVELMLPLGGARGPTVRTSSPVAACRSANLTVEPCYEPADWRANPAS